MQAEEAEPAPGSAWLTGAAAWFVPGLGHLMQKRWWRAALMGGFAASRILEVHGERMVKETFDPGFRIRLHRKDMTIAVDAARALDLSLPNTAATQQLMNAAIAMGDGDKDHSGLIRTLEALAGDKP